MLTGKTPWHDVDPAAVHIKIGYEELQLDLPKGLSEELASVLRCMLQKEPARRPSAQDLLDSAPFNFVGPQSVKS